jgi:hypothetical protein
MVEVLGCPIKDFEMPSSLTGQSIRSPLAGNERGKGHETRHDGREQPQFLLQPPEEAEAHPFAGCVEGGGSRSKLAVCVHEQRVRSIDPSAVEASVLSRWSCRLLCPDSTLVARLRARLTSAWAAWASSQAFSTSSLSAASRRPRSSFSASTFDSFSSKLRLLFSAADLSRTASVCCVRRRSILPSSHRLSVTNSDVSAPDATCSAKAAA